MFLLCVASLAAFGQGWETGAHDTRRTGQSTLTGPAEPPLTHTVVLAESLVLNAPPAVTADGQMLWGTWGVVQRTVEGSNDPRTWDKLDGAVVSLDEQLQTTWTGEDSLETTPFCYDYDGRRDLSWCPDGGEVTFHNGLVDSTPTLTGDGEAWVARADGRLYELDLATGSAEVVLETWNPEDPDDPDGGGALLSSPLALPDGGVLVATAGAGPYQTHAVYAVARGGGVRWRLPSDSASLDVPIWAAPALSPDSATAYVAGWIGPGFNDSDEDLTADGLLLALDLSADDDATDATRVAWQVAPVSGDGDPLYVRQLAVGSDGTLFLAGLASPNEVAWVAAYSDAGEPLWTTALDRDDTELVRGLALREEGGTTTRVLATTGRRASGERDGRLHALDPTDGSVVWTFDPEENGGRGAPSGISLDFDGTAYLSTHGAERRGSVYAVDADGQELWHFCRDEYEGAHPILTPSGHLVVGEADWLECAVTSPLSSTCRSSATDRVVRIYYADEDSAPLASQVAWPCCRCQAGLTPAGSAPLLALLLLVRRRRLR